MEVTIKSGRLVDAEAEILLLTFFEGMQELPVAAKSLDERYGGIIIKSLKTEILKEDSIRISPVYNGADAPVKRVCHWSGLGKKAEFRSGKIARGFFRRGDSMSR